MPDGKDRDYDQNPDLWPESGDPRRKLLDYEGGYGGGRTRAEQSPEHGFGDRGWGGGRAGAGETGTSSDQKDQELPRGAEPARGGAGWDERYARENSDKYGQGGGQPVEQRGAGQSMGGVQHREQSLGDTQDLSPRGGYGTRETENWPGPRGPAAGPHADNGAKDDPPTDDPHVDSSDGGVSR